MSSALDAQILRRCAPSEKSFDLYAFGWVLSVHSVVGCTCLLYSVLAQTAKRLDMAELCIVVFFALAFAHGLVGWLPLPIQSHNCLLYLLDPLETRKKEEKRSNCVSPQA